ncbi:dipeptide ABC transporter ATP-binding protein [Streptacidiphilus monticola]|uniref:Dipeptide ABC transporter ATP-binding protein n=1 Tax=Streptacidiphilus monticola TaxID=2161674 RepID=A0ABW1FXJ2_9ACTN
MLQVEDLSIAFPGGAVALQGLSFDLAAGRTLGLVGESGSGKSAAALALLGLHRGGPAEVTGAIRLLGERPVEVNSATEEQLRRIRGKELAMVFQEPLTSLDPYTRVGRQIAAVHRLHTGSDRAAAQAAARQALERVGIDPKTFYRSYPHEFSGGMRQRALIAMALVLRPRVLVADEPTTALDVTVQAQILRLLDELRQETGMGLILISHDLGVVSGIADEVLVLRRGETVEHGPTRQVLGAPAHPYTRALLDAVPRLDTPLEEPVTGGEALVRVEDLTVRFGSVRALDGVSLEIRAGESLGVVGESGSGKSTLGRTLVRLQEPTSGRVTYQGEDIARWRGSELRAKRRDLQMVFQDPGSSLNPRRSVGDSIVEPLRIRGERDRVKLRAEAERLLEVVGLPAAVHDRYPHQLSGGQRQRAAIARALSTSPRVLVCDEAVSALDVTTQAQVVDLLNRLRRELGISLVFIAHDLAVVRELSDRVAVMRAGRIVETLAAADLTAAQQPYTRALIDAVPAVAVPA